MSKKENKYAFMKFLAKWGRFDDDTKLNPPTLAFLFAGTYDGCSKCRNKEEHKCKYDNSKIGDAKVYTYHIPIEEMPSVWNHILNNNSEHYLSEYRGNGLFRFYLDYENPVDLSEDNIENLEIIIRDVLESIIDQDIGSINMVVNNAYPKRKFHFVCPKVIICKETQIYIYNLIKNKLPAVSIDGLDSATGLRMIGAYKKPKWNSEIKMLSTKNHKLEGMYIPKDGITLETFKDFSIQNYDWNHPKDPRPRCHSKMKNNLYGQLVLDKIEEHKSRFTLTDVDISEFHKVILKYISSDEFRIDPWKEKGDNCVILKRLIPGECPISKSYHDGGRRDAWANTFNGKVYIGCSCKAGNEIYVGSYRKINSNEKNEMNEYLKIKTKNAVNELYNLTDSNKFKIVNKNDKYVNSFPNGNWKFHGIKASFGLGKTTQSNNFIKLNSNKSILILSARISYSNTIMERIERETGIQFDIYSKIKGVINSKYVICQMESIHRLIRDYEIIIIDEVESCLNQLICKNTNGIHFDVNHEIFNQLLISAKHVIFMDAILRNRTIEYFSDLGFAGSIERYTYVPETRTAIKFPFIKLRGKDRETKDDGTGSFVLHLISELRNGKKIFFPCMSKIKQEIFINKIKEELPDKQILVYNKENRIQPGVNVNIEWIKYDLISTTSHITVGINFDVENYFDFVAVYLSTMSNVSAEDTIQSVHRVRYTKERKLYWIHNTWRFKNAENNYKKLKEMFEVREYIHFDTISEIMGADFAANNVKKMSYPMKNLYLRSQCEAAMNILNKEIIWTRCLEESGYTLENMELYLDDIDINNILELEPSNHQQYSDIKDISRIEYEQLYDKKRSEGLTDEESMMILKHAYQGLFIDKRNKYLEIHWDDFLKNKHVAYNTATEKGARIDRTQREKLAIIDTKDCAEFSGLKSAKSDIIIYLTDNIGLNHSRDFEVIIERGIIESISSKIISNESIYQAVFRFRKTQSKGKSTGIKQTLNIINNVIKSWTGTSLKSIDSHNKKFRLIDSSNFGPELIDMVDIRDGNQIHKILLK